MAKIRMKRPGGVPSANRKIVETNQRMGVNNMGQMQGTTRVIMDAVPLLSSAVSTTLNIFENCKTRTFPFTNLSENKLQVGESIAVSRFSLFILETVTATGELVAALPFSYFAQFYRLYGSFLSFSIAQDQVIKKLPLESMFSIFNPYSRFMAPFQSQPAAGDLETLMYSHDIYHMETNLIIPPQIEFVASVQIPPVTVPAGANSFYLAMKIEGIGSLFAPKSTY